MIMEICSLPKYDLQALLQKAGVVASAEEISNFLLLTRITLTINESGALAQLRDVNDVLSSYDLIAVKTTNEKVFHNLCLEASVVDIVTFDLTDKLFKLKHNLLYEGGAKGLFFEMQYSDALKNEKTRRMVLSNMANISRVSRGKHLIFSSGAKNSLQQRSPADLHSLYTRSKLGATFWSLVQTKCSPF